MEENVNPEPNKNKSNKGIFIVVAIMAIIIVALVGYIIVKNSDDSKKSGGEENKVSTSKVTNEIDEEDDDDNDNDEEEKNTSKKNATKNSSKNNTNTADKNNTSKNSAFGKKNKNNTNTTNDTDTNTSAPNKTTAEISSDWTKGEFTIDGVAYKLNGDYKDYVANGWSVDLSKAGYDDGYILNKNDKTYSTIDFENAKFDDANVNVGFINLGDSAKDITECQIWAVSIDNKYSDTPVEFTLPGGIKNGSTLAEVEAAYGKPEEDDIYRSDDLGYTTYTYDNDLKPQLRLTIYDNEGVTQFDYKTY